MKKNEDNISYYADIEIKISENREKYVIKTFGTRFTLKTKEETLELINLQRKFQVKSKEIGFPIVQSTIRYIGKNEAGSHVFREKQQFVDKNLKQVFLTLEDSQILKRYLWQYLSLFKQSWDHDFYIGLDPVVSNFGIDPRDRITYFDLFPAFQRVSGKEFFDWPPALPENKEFITQRYFSVYQVRVIYFQLLRILAIKKLLPLAEIQLLIKEYLGEKAYSIITTPVDVNKIRSIPLMDIDVVRCLASEMFYHGKIVEEDFEKVYALAHVYPHKHFNLSKNLQEIDDILKKSL